MNLLYDVNVDFELEYLDRAVDFLEGEFGYLTGNARWTYASMLWKLSKINPAGKGILAVATIDEKVIGVASLTRKRIVIDGVEFAGAEIGDTYSAEKLRRLVKPTKLIATENDPEHYINKSIFGRLVSELVNAAEDMGIQYIYGTPNNNSLPGYTNKLNFSEVVGYKNLSRSRPTSLFFAQKINLPVIVSKVCIPIISVLSKLHRSIILTIFRPKMIFIKRQYPSDSEIDNLWRCCMPRKGFVVVRDAEYYKYRFQSHPLENYDCHSFFTEGKLSGILITRLQKDEEGKNILVICDYLINKNIKLVYLFNYVTDFYSNQLIVKYNFWCERWGKDFIIGLFSGFIGGSEVPVIYFDLKNSGILDSLNLNMDFHIGSSDNI